MQELIIVKTGSTDPELITRKGDFADWFASGLQLEGMNLRVVDVRAGEALPDYAHVCGVVVTGSHDMVTARADWSEQTALWLKGAVEREIPTLGVCYGHQLLAHALGGKVGYNPDGREFGTVYVYLDEESHGDALLGGFRSPIRVQACHAQCVLQLPPGARRLAHNEEIDNHAFVMGGCAWGVQFHPEFDADIMRYYIAANSEALRAEGQSPDALKAGCADTPFGNEILRRFARVAQEHCQQRGKK